jgi:hypothetical protein
MFLGSSVRVTTSVGIELEDGAEGPLPAKRRRTTDLVDVNYTFTEDDLTQNPGRIGLTFDTVTTYNNARTSNQGNTCTNKISPNS